MVQVLPAVPSFGTKLAQTLGQAGKDIGMGLVQRSQNQKIKSLISSIQDTNTPQNEKLGYILSLSQMLDPEIAKTIIPTLAPFFDPIQAQSNSSNPAQSPSQPQAQPQSSMEGQQPQGQPLAANQEQQPQNLNQVPQTPQQPELTSADRLRQISEEKAKYRPHLSNPLLGESYKAKYNDLTNEENALRKSIEKEHPKLDELQDNVFRGYESARNSEANLNAMETLDSKDKIAGPLGVYLTDLLGLPISLTTNADTEKYQKLISQRATQVSQAYGFGRILEAEFQTFMQTVPSLMNSKQGRAQIIQTLRYFDNIAKARYNAYNDISKGFTGSYRQLSRNLEKAMEPYYDKFGQVLAYGDELIPVKNREGKEGSIPRNQLEAAKAEGYTPL